MKSLLQYFLLLSLITYFCKANLGSIKAQTLRKLSLESPNGVINLNNTGYKHFVLENPRPYDIVIFFTAKDCKLCDTIFDELKLVALFYKQSGALYPKNESNKKLRSVFFAQVVYTYETQKIFFLHKFQSVPNIIVSEQKTAYLDDIQRDYTWQITMTDGQITSQKLLEFINKKTQHNVVYKEPLINLLIVLAILSSVAVLGFYIFSWFKPFLKNSIVWLVCSIVIYVVCMAGVVYNIIHNVPFTNQDQKGNFEWFHSGSRSQFGAEGVLMSISISLSGILMILMIKIPKNFDNGLTKRLVFSLLLFGSIWLIWFVEDIYKKKGWYEPRFWPPAHYIHG